MLKISSIFNSKKCPTAFLICLSFLILVELIVRQHSYYLSTPSDAIIHYKEKILRRKQKDFYSNGILLGDSRALGLHAKEISENLTNQLNDNYLLYNYSFPNHGTQGYYLLLKKYLKYNPKPELIILYISPFALTGEWDINDSDNTDIRNLFRFISLYSIKDCYEILPFKIFIKALLLKIEKLSSFVTYRGRIKDAITNPNHFEEKKEWLESSFQISSGGALIEQNKAPTIKEVIASEYYQTPLDIDPNVIFWLEKFFTFAQDNDIQIIISSAPLVKQIFDKREEDGINLKYNQQMLTFKKKFNNITLTDPLLEGWDIDFFADTHHLNKKGMQRFTQETARKISKVLKPALISPNLK